MRRRSLFGLIPAALGAVACPSVVKRAWGKASARLSYATLRRIALLRFLKQSERRLLLGAPRNATTTGGILNHITTNVESFKGEASPDQLNREIEKAFAYGSKLRTG